MPGAPVMPAPMASVPSFAHQGPVILPCPSCGAYDIRIRTARGRITYLLCNCCSVNFKESRTIIRTISVSP